VESYINESIYQACHEFLVQIVVKIVSLHLELTMAITFAINTFSN